MTPGLATLSLEGRLYLDFFFLTVIPLDCSACTKSSHLGFQRLILRRPLRNEYIEDTTEVICMNDNPRVKSRLMNAVKTAFLIVLVRVSYSELLIRDHINKLAIRLRIIDSVVDA